MEEVKDQLRHCRDTARYIVSGKKKRKKLTHTDFTLISSDCTGGGIVS